MSVYYKDAPDGFKLVVVSYVDDCVYWYTYEELGYWFVNTLVKIFYVNFLGYSNWFMYIMISQLKYHYISVDKNRYDTSVITKFLDTSTIK